MSHTINLTSIPTFIWRNHVLCWIYVCHRKGATNNIILSLRSTCKFFAAIFTESACQHFLYRIGVDIIPTWSIIVVPKPADFITGTSQTEPLFWLKALALSFSLHAITLTKIFADIAKTSPQYGYTILINNTYSNTNKINACLTQHHNMEIIGLGISNIIYGKLICHTEKSLCMVNITMITPEKHSIRGNYNTVIIKKCNFEKVEADTYIPIHVSIYYCIDISQCCFVNLNTAVDIKLKISQRQTNASINLSNNIFDRCDIGVLFHYYNSLEPYNLVGIYTVCLNYFSKCRLAMSIRQPILLGHISYNNIVNCKTAFNMHHREICLLENNVIENAEIAIKSFSYRNDILLWKGNVFKNVIEKMDNLVIHDTKWIDTVPMRIKLCMQLTDGKLVT